MKWLFLCSVFATAGMAAAAPAANPAPAAAPAPAPFDPTAPPPQENRPLRPAFAMENQLIESGGFEMPRVKARMPKDLKEGNILPFSRGEWARFGSNDAARSGGVEAGLTDELARTGRQSIYVKFDHVKATQAAVDLGSDLIPVKGDKKYRVGIWGRIDRKSPLTLDQRAPVLRLQIDFYAEDRETQAGETIFRVQPIPGTANRPLFFTSDRWTEYYAHVDSPAEAAFIRVSWTWSTTPDAGETNGVAFFDDATIEGEKVEPVVEPEPTEDKPDGAPAAGPDGKMPAPPAPGTVPAPAAVPK